MVESLKEYLKDKPCKGFKSIPQYFVNGDFLTYYFKDERCYAKRIDDVLTVYLSNETGELVGFKIKGVKHIITHAGNFGVLIDSNEIRMGLFFFVGAAIAKELSQLHWYNELGRQVANVTLDRSLIAC